MILVPENDLYQANHVQLAFDVQASLEPFGKVDSLILYSAYDADGDGITFYDFGLDGVDGTDDAGEGNGEKDEGENFDEGDDGHELFWEVREPYWSDVLEFLDEKIGG